MGPIVKLVIFMQIWPFHFLTTHKGSENTIFTVAMAGSQAGWVKQGLIFIFHVKKYMYCIILVC